MSQYHIGIVGQSLNLRLECLMHIPDLPAAASHCKMTVRHLDSMANMGIIFVILFTGMWPAWISVKNTTKNAES